MLSMTGFGSAEECGEFGAVVVRIRTLNGKSLRIVWRVSDLLRPFIVEAETLLRSRIHRGSVEVDADAEVSPSLVLEVDEELLAFYSGIAGRFGAVDGAKLLALPGVVRQKGGGCDILKKPFLRALRSALTETIKRRREEGRLLKKALSQLLMTAERLLKKIEKNYTSSVPQLAEQLAAKVRQAMERLQIRADEAGVLREAAIVAERVDIREEMDRMAAHMEEFRRTLNAKCAVGLRLDLLTQEMQREASTMAAKCADAKVAVDILELRTVVVEIRQQVQNVE
ncbi:MAG: hypothetical protein DRP63_00455 [Planctomycetota bacterium]|nr:MAG: hypothetical protein DRP63_00455 [Planctomycetota bacterium]